MNESVVVLIIKPLSQESEILKDFREEWAKIGVGGRVS